MNSKEILIEQLDPSVAFGVHNQNLKTFQLHFPQLKIIGRGNQVILQGKASEIDLFEEKFEHMIHHIEQNGGITSIQLEMILSGSLGKEKNKEENKNQGDQGDVLLYGNHAKVIRAKTPNQRKMVTLMDKNDILFAIGPAGTGKTYTAVALAVRALKNKEIKQLWLRVD